MRKVATVSRGTVYHTVCVFSSLYLKRRENCGIIEIVID